jgi:hypothetical protein
MTENKPAFAAWSATGKSAAMLARKKDVGKTKNALEQQL